MTPVVTFCFCSRLLPVFGSLCDPTVAPLPASSTNEPSPAYGTAMQREPASELFFALGKAGRNAWPSLWQCSVKTTSKYTFCLLQPRSHYLTNPKRFPTHCKPETTQEKQCTPLQSSGNAPFNASPCPTFGNCVGAVHRHLQCSKNALFNPFIAIFHTLPSINDT